jgi:hypothetical protein
MNRQVLSIQALLACALIGFTPVAQTQVNMEAYRDYFLVGQFGEVCTMCEVIILCDPGNSASEQTSIPESGSFTLYHLETRTFWSQIATIWEWFITNFRADSLAASGHTRPAKVYKVDNGIWLTPARIEARLILDPGIIELGNRHINRVNREWLNVANSKKLGYCQRMPLWESLETIATETGGET